MFNSLVEKEAQGSGRRSSETNGIEWWVLYSKASVRISCVTDHYSFCGLRSSIIRDRSFLHLYHYHQRFKCVYLSVIWVHIIQWWNFMGIGYVLYFSLVALLTPLNIWSLYFIKFKKVTILSRKFILYNALMCIL